MKRSATVATIFVGGAIVSALFVIGVIVLISLNGTSPTSQYRDVGVLFGAAIASAGAITAAVVAFQGGHHLEGEKDVRERRRRMDDERVKTHAAITTLHSLAIVIDEIRALVQDILRRISAAAKAKNFHDVRDETRTLPDIVVPIPALRDLDV